MIGRIKITDVIDMLNESLSGGRITNDDIDRDIFTDFGFDSIGMVTFIVEVEERYGIQIEDDALVLENFSTVRNIFEMVNQVSASE